MAQDTRKYKGTKFINYKHPRQPAETVDEFRKWKHAREMIMKHRAAFRGVGELWISQRPCKGWYD